jgi:hypothetical protein
MNTERDRPAVNVPVEYSTDFGFHLEVAVLN